MMYSIISGFTAIATAFSLMFSAPAETSGNNDLYSRIQTVYTSADFNVSLSGESNIEPESLEILDEMLISQHEQDSYYPSSMPFSIKSFLTDVLSSTYAASGSYNIENKGKSGSIYTASNVGLAASVNPSLKITADLKSSLWIEYDFTSLENFKCELILLSPSDVRYVVYDLALMLTQEEKQEMLTAIEDNLLSGTAQLSTLDIQAIAEIARQNSTVTENTKNHAQIVMTNENVKNYFIELLELAFNSMAEELEAETTAIQPIDETMELEFFAPVKEFIKELNLFDDNQAIVSDYYFDDAGKLVKSTDVINFSFNLREVWTKFNNFSDMMYESTIPEYEDEFDLPPSDFEFQHKSEDPWFKLPEGRDDFVFSLKKSLEYKNIGSSTDITKPELTELNSRNIYEEQLMSEIDSYPDDYHDDWYNPYNYVSEYGNAYWRDELTVPLRGFAESVCYGNEEIIYDNGKITIKSNGDTELFETIEARLGSCTVIKDGVSYTLSAPLYTIDGTTRVTEEFFKTLWSGNIADILVYTIGRDETGYYYMTDYSIYIPESKDDLL